MLKRKYFPELSDKQLKTKLLHMHTIEKMSVNMMAKELAVSRDTVYRWCEYFDIKTRDASESMKVRHSKMTPEERKQLARKAHEASRNSKRHDNFTTKIARASTVSERAVMSEHERTFAIHLLDNQLYDFIYSYPYGIFNIDFAFPAHKIAVEVDGGNWHSTKRKQAQDLKKEEFLISEGWTLLRWSTAPHLVGKLPDVIALLRKRVLG